MDIVELVKEIGLNPRLISSTNGGEYKSPCPICGGKDRFVIWIKTGRYWCRQCEINGDLIRFCRDFLKLSYHEACKKVGQEPKKDFSSKLYQKTNFVPRSVSVPQQEWQKRAQNFVMEKHLFALQHEFALKNFQERGFSSAAIEKNLLGWNDSNQFENMNLWGLVKSDGKKKIWLPRGLVIPTFSNGILSKIKIRRADWVSGDCFPKYVEVSGSSKNLPIYGDMSLPLVLVEAELDAMLVQQCAGDLCCCVALGGCGKKPDEYVDELFRKSSQILFALDYDEPGKKNFHFWKSTYPQVKAWPVPREKSPGDALKAGVDIRLWVLSGLQNVMS